MVWDRFSLEKKIPYLPAFKILIKGILWKNIILACFIVHLLKVILKCRFRIATFFPISYGIKLKLNVMLQQCILSAGKYGKL